MRRLLLRAGLALALLVLVLGVSAALARVWYERRFAEFTPMTRAFLERAVARDSVGLAALAADPEPVEIILRYRDTQPGILQQSLRGLRSAGGARTGDSVWVWYASEADWCAGFAGQTNLQVQFVRVRGAWRVRYAGPGIC